MDNQPDLFTDPQLQQFLVDGHVSVQTGHSREFHQSLLEKTQAVFETEGNCGNNLLPRIPAIQKIFDDPAVTGALTSILGPNYFLQPHRHCHFNPPGTPGQKLHRDGFSPRRQHVRWAMAFYFPQDTTEDMGATGIVPRSQYSHTRPDDADEIALCGEAGTVAIVDFNIWHRGRENRSDRNRAMMKFLFCRMEEPTQPSWQSEGTEWNTEPAPGRLGLCRHLWDWYRGRPGEAGGDPASIRPLIAALSDEDEHTGTAAAYALASIGGPAVPALIDVLRTAPDAELWHTIHEGINDGAFPRFVTAHASYALSAMGTVAVPALVDLAGDADLWARASAIEALGDLGPAAREALPVIGAAVNDANVYVRRHAAEALGIAGQGTSAGVPALIQCLRDEDVRVRRNATIALARIGPAAEEAVPALARALEDEDRYVFGNASHALRRIGTGAAVDLLLDFLTTARWCPVTTTTNRY